MDFETHFGIKIVHIYEYYDRPLLFIGKDNGPGALWLIVLSRENSLYEEWLSVMISEERWHDLESNRTDFYSCFTQPEFWRAIYRLVLDKMANIASLYFESPEYLDKDLLPYPGTYVYDNSKRIDVEYLESFERFV